MLENSLDLEAVCLRPKLTRMDFVSVKFIISVAVPDEQTRLTFS